MMVLKILQHPPLSFKDNNLTTTGTFDSGSTTITGTASVSGAATFDNTITVGDSNNILSTAIQAYGNV